MEESESSYTDSENVKWYSHVGKTGWEFLKKLNMSYHMMLQFHAYVYTRNENVSTQKFLHRFS